MGFPCFIGYVMAHSYCRHRFTTMKRWQSGSQWFVIQHCRWCDKWQRKTIDISERAMIESAKLLNEVYKVNDVGIKKVEEIEEVKHSHLMHSCPICPKGYCQVGVESLSRKQSNEPSNSPPQTEFNQ